MNLEQLCYGLAQKLFPKPTLPAFWCDDGHGGIDMEAVEARWKDKAAQIQAAFQEHLSVETAALQTKITSLELELEDLRNPWNDDDE